MKSKFSQFLDGELDVMSLFPEPAEERDISREAVKEIKKEENRIIDADPATKKVVAFERQSFRIIYYIVAVISCVALIGIMLYGISHLPRYGQENAFATEVSRRYIENGLEETGALNIVSGMILDYRAFDTLGESHVLFTALVLVTVLLRRDKKNQQSEVEDYYTVRNDRYFRTSKDVILNKVGTFLVPCILVYGVYVLLNGQLSPGGGFSGGAVMGAAMIIFAASNGFDKVDKFFSLKLSSWVTFAALGFYSFAKGYVFFTGSNGIHNGIPKGTPGAILSGGLILPLDVAVGLVVACTMFGFYSLFRRGNVGGSGK